MARMLRKYVFVIFCCLPYLSNQEKLDNNVRKLLGDDGDYKKSTTMYDYHTRMTAYKDLVGSGCYIEFIKNGQPTLSQRIREFPLKKLPTKLYISEESLSKRRIWELAGSRIWEFCRGFPTYLIQEVQNKNLNDLNTDNDIMKSRLRRKRSTRHYFVGRLRGQTQSQFLNFGHSNNSSGKAEAESTFGTSRATVVGTNGMGQAQSQSSTYDCDECYRPIKTSEYASVGRPGIPFSSGDEDSVQEPGKLTSEREGTHIVRPTGSQKPGLSYPTEPRVTGTEGGIYPGIVTPRITSLPQLPGKVEGGYPQTIDGVRYPPVSLPGRPGEGERYPAETVLNQQGIITPGKPDMGYPGMPGSEGYATNSPGRPPSRPIQSYPAISDRGNFPGTPPGRQQVAHPETVNSQRPEGEIMQRPGYTRPDNTRYPPGRYHIGPSDQIPERTVPRIPDRVRGQPITPNYPDGQRTSYPGTTFQGGFPSMRYPQVSHGEIPAAPDSSQNVYPGLYDRTQGYPDSKFVPTTSVSGTPGRYGGEIAGNYHGSGHTGRFSGQFSGVFDINGQRIPQTQLSSSPSLQYPGYYPATGQDTPVAPTGRQGSYPASTPNLKPTEVDEHARPHLEGHPKYPGEYGQELGYQKPIGSIGPPQQTHITKYPFSTHQPTGSTQQPYDQGKYQPGVNSGAWQIKPGTVQRPYQSGTGSGQYPPDSSEHGRYAPGVGTGQGQYPGADTGQGQYQPGYIRGQEQYQPGNAAGKGLYQPGINAGQERNQHGVVTEQGQYQPGMSLPQDRYYPGPNTYQPNSISRHDQYPHTSSSDHWQYPPGTGRGQNQYEPGAVPRVEQNIRGVGIKHEQYKPGGSTGQEQHPYGTGAGQNQYNNGAAGQGQYIPGVGIQQEQYKPGGETRHEQYPHTSGRGQDQYHPGAVSGQEQYTPGAGIGQEHYKPGAGAGQGKYIPGTDSRHVQNLPGSSTGQYTPGIGSPPGQLTSVPVTQQVQQTPGQSIGQGQYVPGAGTGHVQYRPGTGIAPGQYIPKVGTQQGQYAPGAGQYTPGTVPGQFTSGVTTQQRQYPPGAGTGIYKPGAGIEQGQYRPDVGTVQQGAITEHNQEGFGQTSTYEPDVGISRIPLETTYDDGDSQVQASVQQINNETQAKAQAQGKFEKGTAQSQVSGTYSGTGSFSASAGSDDGKRGALSQVSGGKQGATSSAQGHGGKGKSQAQMQLFSDTGKILSTAQSGGSSHSSQTQVQGGEEGGMANAQSNGSGRTSSQAQIGFSPYKKSNNENDSQKNFFSGGGTASAQGGSAFGQSQSQIQGKFRYGIKYTGGAQAQSGNGINKNFSFIPFDPTIQIKPISLIPQSLSKKEEKKFDVQIDQNTSMPDIEGKKDNATTTMKVKNDEDIPTTETPTDGDDSVEYDYEENETENPTTNKVITQTRDGQTQHIVLPHMRNLDAQVVQTHFDDYHERVFQPGDTFQPGELIPGTSGYRIPNGFRAKVKSVASPSETYALGKNSQAQTVTITPGTGKIIYQKPKNYYNGYRSIYKYNPYQNYFRSGENAMPNFLSISKSETGYENPITGKRVSSTHFTQSSTCGLITNTCIFRKSQRICLPKLTRNLDGSIRVC